ncbi:unnamed protein product, partial [Brenthis ino]
MSVNKSKFHHEPKDQDHCKRLTNQTKEQSEKAHIPLKKLNKDVESSSDSESSCTIASCDSSEYDPRNYQDTETRSDIKRHRDCMNGRIQI